MISLQENFDGQISVGSKIAYSNITSKYQVRKHMELSGRVAPIVPTVYIICSLFPPKHISGINAIVSKKKNIHFLEKIRKC